MTRRSVTAPTTSRALVAGLLAVLTFLPLTVAAAPPRGPVPDSVAARTGPGFVDRDVVLGAVTLHVAEGGPPGAPAVVLLHGFPETATTWHDVAADLAVDHRVIVPDLRGAGRSSFAPPGTDGYTKEALAADLATLAERLALPPATVVGHDMGAMTAYAWARTRRDQVDRLVLAGGGIPGAGLLERGPPHLRGFAAPPGELERRLRGHEREFLGRFVDAGAGSAGGSPALRRLVDDAVGAYGPPGRLDAAFGLYRALDRDAADNRAAPGPLPTPVLVLAGGAPGAPDLTASTVAAVAPRRQVRWVPGAPQVRWVPGAGHFLPTERPREVAAAIREWARPVG